MALSTVAALEAILFTAGEPVQKKRISGLLAITSAEIAAASDELRASGLDRRSYENLLAARAGMSSRSITSSTPEATAHEKPSPEKVLE